MFVWYYTKIEKPRSGSNPSEEFRPGHSPSDMETLRNEAYNLKIENYDH